MQQMIELIQARQLLERWMEYYDGKGHSAGLREATNELISKLPEPPRFVPTPDEAARMERNGED